MDDAQGQLEHVIGAAKTAKHVKHTRMGRKAGTAQEVLASADSKLTDDQATADRALAAKEHILALGRPDRERAATSHCRTFARPTSQPVSAINRLVRYLVWRP